MSTFFRQNKYCSDLDRTADEIIAFATIPRMERTLRFQTHRPQTVNEYVDRCARYAKYCFSLGRPALVKRPERAAELVLDYLEHEREHNGMTAGMVVPTLTAINTWYFTRDLPRPQSRKLSAFCTSARSQHKVVRATPVTPEQIKVMCRHAMATKPAITAARDVALITNAFTTAERPIEVRGMQVEHLDVAPDLRGQTILIPESKGDQEGQGQYVTVTAARDEQFCPVRSMQRWLKVSKITSGYIFRRVDRHGRVGPDEPLTAEGYRLILKSYLAVAGVTGKAAGYSMRRGWATAANKYGASRQEVKEQLRHEREETTRIYIDNAPIPFERSITGVLLS